MKVEQLIGDCKSFVQQEVTVSNCIKLMMCAKEVGHEEIENKAFNYFVVSTFLLTLRSFVDIFRH